MNFGEALQHLKDGKLLMRKGWNGKGMYIKLHHYFYSDIPLNPFFIIRNVQGSFNTWVPSVSDILAEDYEIVE